MGASSRRWCSAVASRQPELRFATVRREGGGGRDVLFGSAFLALGLDFGLRSEEALPPAAGVCPQLEGSRQGLKLGPAAGAQLWPSSVLRSAVMLPTREGREAMSDGQGVAATRASSKHSGVS